MRKINTPIHRETSSTTRERGSIRPVRIEIHPGYVKIWLAGRRDKLSRTWEQIYLDASKQRAEEILAERKQARKEKRNGKSTAE